MDSLKTNICSARKFVLEELAKIDRISVLETSTREFFRVTIHALLPAILCTINSLMGQDSLLPLWLMVVVVAYLIHKKELPKEREQGLYSGIAWIRYATLLAIVTVASCIQDPFSIKPGPTGTDFLNMFFKLGSFQIKACQHIALYRLYLSFFGVLVVTAQKMKAETSQQKKIQKKKS